MELTAQKREIFGKKVKSLRSQGLIPAELYGHGFPNFHLSVDSKEFAKVFRDAGESAIIQLNIVDDSALVNVLIHDIQRGSLTDEITHIDFYQVRMDEKITAQIPVRLIGEAPAVKDGGILIRAMQEMEVEALPAELPHDIPIDISGLEKIGSSLYVRDIQPIKGVKFLVDPETVVATVKEPAKEEIEEKPVTVEDVKVEGEEKKEKKEKGEERVGGADNVKK